MKKNIFINPSASVIKVEASAIICGSGSENGQIGKGGSSSATQPEVTDDGNGHTGIFGEARNGALGLSLDVMDF